MFWNGNLLEQICRALSDCFVMLLRNLMRWRRRWSPRGGATVGKDSGKVRPFSYLSLISISLKNPKRRKNASCHIFGTGRLAPLQTISAFINYAQLQIHVLQISLVHRVYTISLNSGGARRRTSTEEWTRRSRCFTQ